MKKDMLKLLHLFLTLLFLVIVITGCQAKQEAVDPANCKHEQHDPETTRCLVCNKKIDYHYTGDTCDFCGKKTEFLWDCIRTQTDLMNTLKDGGHEQKGTVERMTYETFAYNIHALTGEEKMIEKEAFVYLPYGYDASNQYNLLVLQHGSGDTAGYWFAQEPYHANDSTYVSTGK